MTPYREPPPLDDRVPEVVYPVAVEADPFPFHNPKWSQRVSSPFHPDGRRRPVGSYPPPIIEPECPPPPLGARGFATAMYAKLEAAWDVLATVLSEL